MRDSSRKCKKDKLVKPLTQFHVRKLCPEVQPLALFYKITEIVRVI